MAGIGINLIKGRTMSVAKRRRQFWFMMVYLAACSACVVLAANYATKSYITARRRRNEMKRLESRFLNQHEGGGTLPRYAAQLRDEMDRIAEDLDTAGDLLERRIRLASVLAGLALPLEGSVNISELSFDGDAGIMRFSLVTPASPRGEAIRATDLVAAWNENPIVTSQMGPVTPVGTQRDKVNGQPVIILKFEAGRSEGEEDG